MNLMVREKFIYVYLPKTKSMLLRLSNKIKVNKAHHIRSYHYRDSLPLLKILIIQILLDLSTMEGHFFTFSAIQNLKSNILIWCFNMLKMVICTIILFK